MVERQKQPPPMQIIIPSTIPIGLIPEPVSWHKNNKTIESLLDNGQLVTLTFTQSEADNAKELIRAALKEDLNQVGDLTCKALIPESRTASVNLVARENGILAGLPVASLVFEELDPNVEIECFSEDGNEVSPGEIIANFTGPLNSLLIGERTVLNFLTHLAGIASLTNQFVSRIKGTKATILDTRKTLPGYRLLAKYAVRAGGGTNHRMGLYDGILIKDNHLAAWTTQADQPTIERAIKIARQTVSNTITIEVEVDTLEQHEDALHGPPDIILLDNMTPEQMKTAIELRDRLAPHVLLEASGGVNLETVREIAETGVERISIGALTHSAPSLDLAFDWKN